MRILLLCYLLLSLILVLPAKNASFACQGINLDNFSIYRTTYGLPDNDLNGLPDVGGTLNFDLISLDNLMMGDEFKARIEGSVNTKKKGESWAFGFGEFRVKEAKGIIAIMGAKLLVKDADSGKMITCDQVVATTSDLNGDLLTVLDISIPQLLINGCSDLQNFTFSNGDSVTVEVKYKVIKNVGAVNHSIQFQSEMYLSDLANPLLGSQKFGCGQIIRKANVLGYEFKTESDEQYDFISCEGIVRQDYSFAVGGGSSSADLFPYEYRNWASIRNLVLELPVGYQFVEASLQQSRSSFNGNFLTETENEILPISANGQSLTFDLNSYHVAAGGSINFSNNSFFGTVEAKVSLKKGVPYNSEGVMNWSFQFSPHQLLETPLPELLVGRDYLRNENPVTWIESASEIICNADGSVSWEINTRNTSNLNASYPWLYFLAPNGGISVVEVMDLSSNLSLSQSGNLFVTKELQAGETRKFRITATPSICEIVDLKIYAGNGQGEYPANFASVACAFDLLTLNTKTVDSQLEVSLLEPDKAAGFPLTTDMFLTSKGNSAIKDVVVELTIPSNLSLKLTPGSLKIANPAHSDLVSSADPLYENYTYTIPIAEAIAGQQFAPDNEVHLQFQLETQQDFQSSQEIVITSRANNTCGEVLPQITNRIELNHYFDNTQEIGLTALDNSWGFSWGDYDGDDYPDLFVTNYDLDQPNKLYHNNGDGTFTQITDGAIANDLASSIGSSWGDYDNDGDLDLYVTNNIGDFNFLYRNNGDGTFTRVLDDPVVSYKGYSHGVSWIDYDNDGFLDLFITDFFASKFNLLYHNNGDGTFTQITTSILTLEAASSVSASWGDYDNDGDPDLFVSNTNDENNSLYRNEGGGNFTAITDQPLVKDGGKSTGASWGDIDNDGDLDLFVSNAGNQNNFLYINDGQGVFTKITSGIVVNEGGHSHGSAFGDYDNDGDLDLVVTNDNGQENFFYLNTGHGTFDAYDLGIGFRDRPSRKSIVRAPGDNSFATGWADFDRDGDLDLYVVNHGNSQNYLYINEGGNFSNSACITLRGLGTNNAAIGARIQVLANIYGTDQWQTREISSQTGGGVSSQSELRQHFGIGDATQLDSIIVTWPSGFTQHIGNSPVTNCLQILEEAGAVLSGIVFNDINGSCTPDTGEPMLGNIALEINPGQLRVVTDGNGEYNINLTPGSYTVSQLSNNNWQAICAGLPQSHTVNITQNNGNFSGYNFSNQSTGNCNESDLSINGATTALRTGFEAMLAVNFANEGTQDANDIVLSIDFGPEVVPLASSLPWNSSSGSVYFWQIPSLSVGALNTIFINTEVNASATIGETNTFTYSIQSASGDCNLANNIYSEEAVFVGAIDPNDILVFPQGNIPSKENLNYKIRFQNVGNHAAKRVIIKNPLPATLDINTMILGAVSHDYRFYIENQRTLVWEFDNINLPDSTTNTIESNGFVSYRILPKVNQVNGTEIANSALIYFDHSQPIKTNTVINHIDDRPIERGGKVVIYPNPTVRQVILEIAPRNLKLKQVEIKSIAIFNAIGQRVYWRRNLNQYRHSLNTLPFAPGHYIVKIIGADHHEYIGRIVRL